MSGADCGSRLLKRQRVRTDHSQIRKSKVADSARGRSDIQWVARSNQHHGKAVGEYGSKHDGFIVSRCCQELLQNSRIAGPCRSSIEVWLSTLCSSVRCK